MAKFHTSNCHLFLWKLSNNMCFWLKKNRWHTVTKASIISELYLEVPQGRSWTYIYHRSFKVYFPRYCKARNISRFLFCTVLIEKSTVYHVRLEHINPTQVKNVEMFLSSCWLNLENFLSVLRKKNLEIFIATTRIVSNYS